MKYVLIKEKTNKQLATMKLKNLECKHIANIDSEITKLIFEQSKTVNYKWVIFGSHRNGDIQEEIRRIKQMRDLPQRAIKIVITNDGRYWVDNTHWYIAYILKYGMDTQLSQVPHYIVDFRFTTPTITSINGSVIEEEVEIIKTIKAAYEIEKRVKNNWRPSGNWTVEHLIQQFPGMANISKNHIVIDPLVRG